MDVCDNFNQKLWSKVDAESQEGITQLIIMFMIIIK